MLRKLSLVAFGALSAALAGTVSASADGYTTRIETRPFYGAVVTLEEGVRVFRPLPVERQVIINPGGQTPLSLGFNETNVYERRIVENYNYGGGGGSAPAVYGRGGGFPYVPGYGRGNHGHRMHGGGGGVAAPSAGGH